MDESKNNSRQTALSSVAEAPCIAVVGMAGRFPGARNVAEFWRNIRDGVESISFLTDEQLRAAGASQADLRNPAYVKAASILDDIDLFDAAFFGFSPKDAAIMDPQHRLFLEAAWEALEDAGWISDEFDGRIGVYAGSGFNAYLTHNLLTNEELLASSGLFLLKQTGNDKDVLATRVSYQLNLTGPSVTIQTACSTSLVAIHIACQSLLNHECDLALAGGVTIEIPHGQGYIYRENEILSRDGHCRAFDTNSSGTVFGSGLGIVVLRRLEDALRDGDSIRAVVRATAINNDGARKAGFLAPSVQGQAEVIAEALALAAIDARSISLIEAHGTGTKVGDPIEVAGLTRAFRESTADRGFCAIGSVKTNVGHLDAAAGVAAFIKTVLALEHQQLPPSLNFLSPNSNIDFENSPFFVNTELRDWQLGGVPRRAGVTSLGIGGTNAHAILEEAPQSTASSGSRPLQLLTLSAKTASALKTMSRNLGEYLADNPDTNLADVAFTLHRGRKSFSHRRTLITRDAAGAAKALLRGDKQLINNTAQEREPGVGFLFSGQGAQYPGMGRELYETEAEFQLIVDHCATFLQPYLGLDLRELMFAREDRAEQAVGLLNQTQFTQPALFTLEYALATLWRSWGIKPDAMIGHSIGEYAAACVAKVFSLETALRIVAERGRLMQSLPPGAMTAVALPEREIAKLLGESLALASINGEQQCVVSGSEAAITELEASLAARGVTTQRLRTSHAFHSPMMDPILRSFTAFVRRFELNAPRTPFVSSVTGAWITNTDATDPGYWACQLRQTVRFSDGLSLLLEGTHTIYLEVGPGRTLTGLTLQHGKRSDQEVVASMRSQRDRTSDVEVVLSALGRLWAAGKPVDWKGFHAREARRRMPLPTYPFERRRHWIDPGKRLGAARAADLEEAQSSVPAGGLFHPVWKRLELATVTPLAPTSSGPWLIFSDALGFGAALADVLRSRGEQCIEVVPGSKFARLDEFRFQIAPASRGDYDVLVAQLQAMPKVFRTIVYFWTIVDEAHAEDLDRVTIEERSFYSLLFLAQSLGEAAFTEEIELGIVSNSLQQVAGEPVCCPERALLEGPCGVIPKELSNIHCRNIDVVLPARGSLNGKVGSWRSIALQIFTEMSTESDHRAVAYRGNRRWVRTVEPLGHKEPRKPRLLRNRGTYVITGGLGGIGLVLGEALAKAVQARLVLVSHSPFCAREQWDRVARDDGELADQIRRIRSIESAGGEVLIVTADVCDPEAMERVARQARERFREIHGIIHAAGVLDDAPILKKDPSRAAKVIAPKFRGTLVVESCFKNEPLDFFIVLSSLSSLTAPAGQMDYVAANAFLDTLAQVRYSTKGYPTVAIQWPRWRDVGMVAKPRPTRDFRPDHPLLSELVSDDGREVVFETRLRLDRDWIVGEHQLKGAGGLFPGTGYVEMARAAIAANATVDGTLDFRDLQFKAPLRVEPGVEQTVRLVLRKTADGQVFSVLAKVEGARDTTWTECASGKVGIVECTPAASSSLEQIRRRCNTREIVPTGAQNEKQGRHLGFGPRWNALRRIFLGDNEALAVVELGAQFDTDLSHYKLHPALLDMATGAAMFLISGYDSINQLYVPMSYDSLTVHGPLPMRCYSHIRARADATAETPVASFDVSILDEKGSLIVEAENFSLYRIGDPGMLNSLAIEAVQKKDVTQAAVPVPMTREAMDRWAESISAAEGADFFVRILAGEYAPNVTPYPGDLTALLEKPARKVAKTVLPATSSNEGLPTDEIEATLAKWWKDLLGLETVSKYDDFFAVGGQSLTALRLFALVKKTYGVELGLPVLLNAPTIEKLRKILRKEQAPLDYSAAIHDRRRQISRAWISRMRSGPLIELKRGDPRKLFLVHDGEGETLLYLNLARRMPDDLAVFGIEPRRIARVPLAHTRIEDMAAFYIEEVRKKQPHGPYLLGGLCAGGVIAYEMASQLVYVGERVELVALLDAAAPNAQERSITRQRIDRLKQALADAQRKEAAILKRARVVVGAISQKAVNLLLWEFSQRGKQWSVRARFRLLHELLRHDLAWPGFVPELSVRQIYGSAQAQYVPKPLSISSIVLVRAQRGDASVADDTPYQEIYTDETLGWNALANNLTVVDVDGGHSTMLQERFVDSLAEVLMPYLQQKAEPANSPLLLELQVADSIS